MASHTVSLSVWPWALGSNSVREGASVASVGTEEARCGSGLRSTCPVSGNLPPDPPESSNEALFRLLSEG